MTKYITQDYTHLDKLGYILGFDSNIWGKQYLNNFFLLQHTVVSNVDITNNIVNITITTNTRLYSSYLLII